MARLAGCGLLTIPAHLKAEEPFDSLPLAVWQNARRNGLVMIHHPTPAHMSSRVQVASNDEPAEALIVSGQVFAPDGRTPVPGIVVYAYNTDSQGYYGENKAEYPPRLFGWTKTDDSGRFELRTIGPGLLSRHAGPCAHPLHALGKNTLCSGRMNYGSKATGTSPLPC
jgi:protocatechuate 3,4-dioxygenase beta subunit